MVCDPFNGILYLFAIWKGLEVSEMFGVLMVVVEHVWGEDWVSEIPSRDIKSKVAMLLDIRDLV